MFIHGELEGARIEIGRVAVVDVTVRVHPTLAKRKCVNRGVVSGSLGGGGTRVGALFLARKLDQDSRGLLREPVDKEMPARQ